MNVREEKLGIKAKYTNEVNSQPFINMTKKIINMTVSCINMILNLCSTCDCEKNFSKKT